MSKPPTVDQIKYRASGRLLAAASIPGDMFLILVERNALPFVVSRYLNGESEWISGTHYKTYQNAVKQFTAKLAEEIKYYVDR